MAVALALPAGGRRGVAVRQRRGSSSVNSVTRSCRAKATAVWLCEAAASVASVSCFASCFACASDAKARSCNAIKRQVASRARSCNAMRSRIRRARAATEPCAAAPCAAPPPPPPPPPCGVAAPPVLSRV
eukprot:scaffold49486_cov57-Phaeocystis_antarctica.AAC.1